MASSSSSTAPPFTPSATEENSGWLPSLRRWQPAACRRMKPSLVTAASARACASVDQPGAPPQPPSAGSRSLRPAWRDFLHYLDGLRPTRRRGFIASADGSDISAAQMCPGRDSNPYGPFGPEGFKPSASAISPPGLNGAGYAAGSREAGPNPAARSSSSSWTPAPGLTARMPATTSAATL